MKLDELRLDISEGITHIEELEPREFLKAVKTLNTWEITEKMDGAAMQFGFDNDGFFTAREKKGGTERIRNADEWGNKFMHTGFRSAHMALEKLMGHIYKQSKLIEKDALYSVEVLFGTLPNAIPYSEETNQIVIIGKDGADEDGSDNMDKMKKHLNNESVAITVDDVPYTEDGRTIKRRSETHDWEVVTVPKVRSDGIKKEEAWSMVEQGVKNLEDWLKKEQLVGSKTMSNEDLLSLPMNKKPEWIGDGNWKEVKAVVAPLKDDAKEQMKSLGLDIKGPLLDMFVRGVRSHYGPSIEDGGWIEGVVAKNPKTGDLTKIVDKEAFTAINKHNWSVRSNIGDMRNAESVLQKVRRAIADEMGHSQFATTQAKRYIAKFGDSAAEQVSNLAADIDFDSMRTKMGKMIKTAHAGLTKLHDDYNTKDDETSAKNTQKGVHSRNLETFADAFVLLESWNKELKNAKTSEDLIVLFIGNKIVAESIRIGAENEKLLEGGNATKEYGTGAIHINEIESTLRALSNATKIPYDDIKNGVLGSVGKAEFSGDIDISLDGGTYDKKELFDQLNAAGLNPVMGAVISFPFPIDGYDETKESEKDRTGLVQVDFMFGNTKVHKFGYHSAGDGSKYKGMIRTILVARGASAMNQLFYDEGDDELVGRFGPAFSPNAGLNIHAKMRPRKGLSAAQKKAGETDTSGQPRLKGEKKVSVEDFKNEFPSADVDKFGKTWTMDEPDDIAQFLFGDVKSDVTADDLDRVETVIPLIRKKSPELQKVVLGRFKDRLVADGMEIPKELENF